MKKLGLLCILATFILAGCSQQQWLSQDEVFEKKQECSRYKDKMNIQVSGFSNLGNFFEVDEIFYSPVKNSCLYTAKVKNWEQISIEIENSNYAAIIDYFNNVVIESTFSELSNSSAIRSNCSTKYLTDDLEKIEDINIVKKAMQDYFSCIKNDFDIKFKELKWE